MALHGTEGKTTGVVRGTVALEELDWISSVVVNSNSGVELELEPIIEVPVCRGDAVDPRMLMGVELELEYMVESTLGAGVLVTPLIAVELELERMVAKKEEGVEESSCAVTRGDRWMSPRSKGIQG